MVVEEVSLEVAAGVPFCRQAPVKLAEQRSCIREWLKKFVSENCASATDASSKALQDKAVLALANDQAREKLVSDKFAVFGGSREEWFKARKALSDAMGTVGGDSSNPDIAAAATIVKEDANPELLCPWILKVTEEVSGGIKPLNVEGEHSMNILHCDARLPLCFWSPMIRSSPVV